MIFSGPRSVGEGQGGNAERAKSKLMPTLSSYSFSDRSTNHSDNSIADSVQVQDVSSGSLSSSEAL